MLTCIFVCGVCVYVCVGRGGGYAWGRDVRGGGRYESKTIMSTLEYRDDTPDALEVSVAL